MYNSVGRPRFYVCTLQWLKSLGKLNVWNTGDFLVDQMRDLIGINPSHQITLNHENTDGSNDVMVFGADVDLNTIMYPDNAFNMILGHNMYSARASCETGSSGDIWNWVGTGNYVNGAFQSGRPDYNGFSIHLDTNEQMGSAIKAETNRMQFRFDSQLEDGSYGSGNTPPLKIGSLMFGNYYTMPHSPDLSLTQTIEYGGTTTQETRGGATLTNSTWLSQPKWGDLGAWELSNNGLQPFHSSGRRTWNLSFSFLDSSDILGSNSRLTKNTMETEIAGSTFEDGDVSNNIFNYDILTDYNFYSQVIHKTAGGLPFVFQPDVNDKTNFAIASIPSNTIKLTQVSFGVYNIKLKIREIW